MEKIFSLVLTLALLTLTFSSCTKENECDERCPAGMVQLLDCSCVTEFDCTVTCSENQILDAATCECVDISNPILNSSVEVNSNITENTTWTADKEYLLGGRISVTNGATLTIEPGTIIKGKGGAEANSKALLVTRGSKIEACGTASAPIIMTSILDEITPAMVAEGNFASPNLDPDVPGLWGGLIILGNARISIEGDAIEAQIEGIPTSDSNGLYGGTDDSDNSGSLCYVSIRHGGTNIGDGNEINGLTLGGVGSGTTIDNIEIVANADDGIEWFGGSVSCSNLLVWNCGDDGMDTDQGFSGTITNWAVAVPQGGSGMELDGPEGTSLGICNNFISGTIFGGNNIDHFIDWDDSTNTGVSELYIFGINSDYDAATAIESLGGDGNCTTDAWEYTAPEGYDSNTFFLGSGASAVEMNANSVGCDGSTFGWTWGSASGTLAALGLE